MKDINFFVVMLMITIMPMFLISCGDKNDPTPDDPITTTSILGEWKLVDVTYTIDGDSGGDLSFEKDQVWSFDKKGILTISGDTYNYTLTDNKLTTSYAEEYKSDHFIVNHLSSDKLVISATHVKETKVGDQEITYTLQFDYVSK